MRNKRPTLHTWKAQVDQLPLPLYMDYGSSLLILTKSIMVRRAAESPKCLATSPSLGKGSYETTGLFLPRVSGHFFTQRNAVYTDVQVLALIKGWLYVYWAKQLFWSSWFRTIRMDFPEVRGWRQTTSVIRSLPKSDDWKENRSQVMVYSQPLKAPTTLKVPEVCIYGEELPSGPAFPLRSSLTPVNPILKSTRVIWTATGPYF